MLGRAVAAACSPLIAKDMTVGAARASQAALTTGAEALAASGFAILAGKRVGLVTNHTGRIGDERLVDVLAAAPGVRLAALLTPEHGLGGVAEAGAKVASARDRATGLAVHSLYGATLKPTPAMLAGLDLLVFDMQDIGARFYTYVSTMGLAMQAAAEARLPFVVLDRPNPLGGDDVAGFVLEPRHRSFIGLYAIPQVHGLTAGELAQMIRGERLLTGLVRLDLEVVRLGGWRRDGRWPQTGRAWLATSPNIPTFETALVYAGTGLVEQTAASEGRGTEAPFLLIGHPAVDADRLVATLTAAGLPGTAFEPARFTPRPIAGVASRPRFSGREVPGIRIRVTDATAFRPVETGVHVLCGVDAEVRARGTVGIVERADLFARIAGTGRMLQALDRGASATAIIASWHDEVARFRERRARYLLY